MRRAAPSPVLTPARNDPAPGPARLSRTALVLLAAGVIAVHVAVLGWVPVGTVDSSAVDLKTVHLVTRVVPVAPPPLPKPKPRPRPPEPKPEAAAEPAPDAPPVADAGPEGTTDTPGAADAPPTATPLPAEPEPPPAAPPPAAPPPPPPPMGPPESVRLRYNMEGESKGLQYHARAELLWEQNAAHYKLRMEVSAFLLGSRSQTSEGAIGPAGLEPETFSDHSRKTEVVAHFDRAGQRIVFSNNAPEAVLPAGVQDRLGVFLQLSSMLAGDPSRYPQGTGILIPTASARDLEPWTFVVGPQETIQLPIGTEVAVKLERAPRKDFDTRVEVWFAPALGYLPVRMRVSQQNGDYIDQTLMSAERP